MALVCRQRFRVARIDDGKLHAMGEAPCWTREGDEIVSQGSGPFGATDRWRLPAYVAPFLEAFDGRRTLGEIIARFDDEFGRDAIVGLVQTLCPEDIGLLAPA
jgi:hypothetical protein